MLEAVHAWLSKALTRTVFNTSIEAERSIVVSKDYSMPYDTGVLVHVRLPDGMKESFHYNESWSLNEFLFKVWAR